MGYLGASLQWARIGTIALLVFIFSAHVFAYEELTDDALRNIPSGADDFDIKTGSLLSPILIPRVPGTPGSIATQHHFVDFFSQQLPGWRIEWHNSTSKTPATGDTDIPFTNLIITRDPPWAQVGDVGRLTLVAHYDSLYHPEGFIGATDSAAPCAVLMHVARSIDKALTKKWEAMEASGDAGLGMDDEKGVQILLLDGEEAWVTWTDTDSLYGSRALAESWESEVHPALSTFRTPLDSISLFLLLDLLGAAEPHVPSYFLPTHWAYQNMAKIEERMRKLDLLNSKSKKTFLPDSEKHVSQFSQAYVLDDHVPFLIRGVNVLHVIPSPFPDTWHTMEDDGDHLDIPTLGDWAKIVTAFAAEWMELDEFMSKSLSSREEGAVRDRTEL
ncbi:glutaminyl-peptide cyclotransferase [Annulohypoxylon maeteangense]|uniref:glutaminyl-peptide cyclotransferase n=1 Tax=Annulohypoxylon maeteangense TaxID=1927788 RepID=UPI00200756FC|nr:glutaminyl-peptide cyclotransferase [Annulohypoxylon maeteangense]KAI0882191.1 glutaminyl-peptide cyclotransferase [Annulohypoxylon maeteangense]